MTKGWLSTVLFARQSKWFHKDQSQLLSYSLQYWTLGTLPKGWSKTSISKVALKDFSQKTPEKCVGYAYTMSLPLLFFLIQLQVQSLYLYWCPSSLPSIPIVLIPLHLWGIYPKLSKSLIQYFIFGSFSFSSYIWSYSTYSFIEDHEDKSPRDYANRPIKENRCTTSFVKISMVLCPMPRSSFPSKWVFII